jgi:hypothetical protein
LAASIKKLQVATVPLQSPLQPLRALPLAGVAVSVTEVRAWNVAVQDTAGQLMPAGLEVTVPLPTTLTVTGLKKSADTAV